MVSIPTITLNAVDTGIPNIYNDSTSYTISFQVSNTNPVRYRNGTSGSWQNVPISPSTVGNITSNSTTPFQIQLNDSNGNQQILTLYLNYGIVIPQVPSFSLSNGVIITHSGSNYASVLIQTPS